MKDGKRSNGKTLLSIYSCYYKGVGRIISGLVKSTEKTNPTTQTKEQYRLLLNNIDLVIKDFDKLRTNLKHRIASSN